MSITPGTFTNGTAITENAVRTELDRIRDWINGAVLPGDVTPASLSKMHIHRAATAGYPKENVEGQTQQVTEVLLGLNDPTPSPSLDASTGTQITADLVEDQRNAFLESLLEGDLFRIEGKRIALFGTSAVEVTATLFAATTNDSGQAADQNAGTVRLRYQEVNDNVTHGVAGSARRMNAAATTSVGGKDVLHHSYYEMIGMVEGLTEGVYDFWLEYNRNGAGTGLGQVTFLLPTILIETHEA